MPLVPPLMVVVPIVYVLYWIFACDEDLDESCHCADLRPSMQVLYENFHEDGRCRFLCCDTSMCHCLRGKPVRSCLCALAIFIIFTIPLFMVIMVIAVGFCSTVGTVLGLLTLICYQIRVLIGVSRLVLS